MKNLSERKISYLALMVLMLLGITACGGGGSSSPATNTSTSSSVTYSTTSNKGDYSEWTFAGDQLSAIWEVINVSGNVDYTYTIAATCAVPDVNNVRSCIIDTGSCADGASVCTGSPSGSFDTMEVPGVAIFVHTTASTGGENLQVGFVKDSGACAEDVSGDYTFIRVGLGLDENFGMFRSDANLLSVLHSEFGFDAPDGTTTPVVAYRTSDGGSATLTDNGCNSGVRERVAGTDIIRSMITASGVFVLDFPAGQGGMLAFNVNKAATLADFSGKNFAGISFPDKGSAETLNAVFSTLSGGKVNVVATVNGVAQNFYLMNLGTIDALTTAPAYPDFTVSPGIYSSDALSSSYASPSVIPGLFKIGGSTDTGRIVMAAMKFNNKVIGLGMVYNYRTTSDTDPSTGANFGVNGLYNTGNFILFEK